MKKIIILFFIIFSSINSIFAYNPTTKDEKTLNSIYSKIDLIGNKNSEKVVKLLQQIEILKGKYINNEKINYLLYQIEEYINEKYNRIEYDLVNIIDGDTISINYNGEERKVRLIGINAPETKNVSYNTNCLGVQSKEFLIKKLENTSKIKIEFDLSQGKTDSFGRLLGYLFLSGTNINKLLIEQGLAYEYTYNKKKPYKYQQFFIDANNIAKENMNL